MNIFVVSFILMCLLGFFCAHLNPLKRYKNIFLIASGLLLFYIRAFADPASLPDLGAYKIIYDTLAKYPVWDVFTAPISYDRTEAGFRLLMRACSLFGLSFSGFLVVFGALWVAAYITVIRRHTDYVIVAVLLLSIETYGQSLFVLRQHLAVVVFFLSFKYIINKDLIKYLVMIALAYSLHRTAFIALPAYFLYNTENRKVLIALIGLTAAAALIVTSNVSVIRNMSVMSEYSGYLADDQVGTNYTLFLTVLVRIVAYVYILREHIWEEGTNRLLLVLMFVGLIVGIAGVGFAPTVRLSLYYTSTTFLAVPKMCEYCKTRWLMSLIVIVFMGMYVYRAFMGSNTHYFLRYQNVFFETIGF